MKIHIFALRWRDEIRRSSHKLFIVYLNNTKFLALARSLQKIENEG